MARACHARCSREWLIDSVKVDNDKSVQVSFGPITLGSSQPLVEPYARDTERSAHQLHLPDTAMLSDEREPQG